MLSRLRRGHRCCEEAVPIGMREEGEIAQGMGNRRIQGQGKEDTKSPKQEQRQHHTNAPSQEGLGQADA